MTYIMQLIAIAVVFLLLTRLLGSYFKARRAADKNIMEANRLMFARAEVIYDAAEDVPEDVLDLVNLMTKVSCTRFGPTVLVNALINRPAFPSDNSLVFNAKIQTMRDPLPRIFEEFTHAWFVAVSNRSLFARFLVRSELGRKLEKQRDLTSDGYDINPDIFLGKNGLKHC